MGNVQNIRMGYCTVTYKGTDLGHTKDGVEVTYTPEYYNITVDQYGNTPVDQALIGEQLTAKVVLAEYTVLNLGKAIPQGTLAGTNTRLTIGADSGKRSKDDSGFLLIHPTEAGAATTFDVAMYQAIVTSAVVLPHKIDGERVMEVTFTALVDETRSDGNRLGLIGNSLA